MYSERIPCGLCRRVKRANMMKIIPYIKNPLVLPRGSSIHARVAELADALDLGRFQGTS